MSSASSAIQGEQVLDENGQKVCIGVLVALTAGLIYVFWPTLRFTAEFWSKPEYSHGWLVPAFTCVLLWMRRQPFVKVSLLEMSCGVGILAGTLALRLFFSYYSLLIPDMVMFVPALLGLVVTVGGWHALKWAWPPIVFILFMYPLPDFVERSLLMPMQNFATAASTYLLQVFGLGAYREGNRILIGELQLGVVDACSGLRMLTIFFALSVAITMVTERPLWERLVIIASAAPIALAVNIARITVTGVLYVTTSPELADRIFHDAAGWVMMPMALGLLYLELQLLANLFVEEDEANVSLDLGGPTHGAGISPI